MSLRSALANTIPLVVACSLLLSACGSANSPIAEPATPTPIPTTVVPEKPTYTVARGDVTHSITFDARIVPVVSQDLSFKISGQVLSVQVQEGDAVKKGQLLAELKTSANPFDLRRAQIDLQKAQLAYQLAQLDTPAGAKDAEVLLALKKADVDLAQLTVDELTQKADAAKLVASMDGTVAQIAIREGDSVEALKPAITLTDPSELEASADLDSATLQVLAEGMPVTVFPSGDEEAPVAGTIRRMPYPYGQNAQPNDPGAADRSVRFTLTGSWHNPGFALGNALRAQVVLENHPNTLWLPPQAVRKFQGNTFVVVLDSSTQRRVDVQLGLSTDEKVEILQGLSEGQVVVAP